MQSLTATTRAAAEWKRSRNAVAEPVIVIFLPRPRLWFQVQRELA
jgi:hypothetical protein